MNTLAIKLLLTAGALLVVGIMAYNKGYESSEYQHLKEAQETAALVKAKEIKARAEAEHIHNRLYQEIKNADNTINALRRDLRDGSKRMRVPVVQGSVDCTTTGTTSGTVGTQTAELDGKAADALSGIVQDGDNAIRERNALIDMYRTAEKLCSVTK